MSCFAGALAVSDERKPCGILSLAIIIKYAIL